MKIFRAAKLKSKKRSNPKHTRLRKSDWEVLMQHDHFTGKLDLSSEEFGNDPDSVKRLLKAEMIFPDGYLTPEARKKCAELATKLQDSDPSASTAADSPKADEPMDVSETQLTKFTPPANRIVQLTASDWAVLMKYDRKTGNLLQYDPETGQLDETSRAILKDPEIIQRLIDNSMILPGGWLTPEAKAECNRIEEKLEARAADGYKEAKEDTSRKEKAESEEENLPGEVPSAKHDAIVKPALRSKYKALAADMSNLQSFFEQLPAAHSEPEHSSNGEIQSIHKPGPIHELSSKDSSGSHGYPDPERRSYEKLVSKGDRQSKEELPLNQRSSLPDKLRSGLQKAQKQHIPASENSATRPDPVQNTTPAEPRHIDLKAHSKFKSNNRSKRKRKKKGSDSSGGRTNEPPRFSLRDVFHIIFKRKIQILSVFFAIVLAAIVVTLKMDPVYEASTQILVKLGRESVFVPTAGNVNPILNINREQQVNSEIEILKSRALAENVVAALGPTVLYQSLAREKSGILNKILPTRGEELTPAERKAADFESAVSAFMKALNVAGVKKSNVIKVSFRNEDPRMAATAVNQLANLYREHHLAVHKVPQNVTFFQEQTLLLKNKLDQSEEKLKALRKQHNITSLEEQRTLLLGQSSQLSSSLNQTVSLEVETEKRIRQLRKQLASVPRTVSQGEEGDPNPYLINTLEARLVELQLKEKELLTKYTDNSRLVLNVKEEIRVVTQKLKEQETKRSGRRTSGVNPTYQRLKEELFRNEAELEALKAKKVTQKEHYSELQVKLDSLNQVELELKQLEQEIEVDRENYRLYLSKVEESRISDAMDSEKIASVSLIGPARPPQEPVSPKKKLNLLIGIFLGLFFSMSLALFREYLDDRIEKIEDVENELRLPVLASIPVFEQRATGT